MEKAKGKTSIMDPCHQGSGIDWLRYCSKKKSANIEIMMGGLVKPLFHRAGTNHPTICMEPKKASSSQSNIEKEQC